MDLIDGGFQGKNIKIGSLKVFAIGLGCMGLTHASGVPMIVAESAKVLPQAFDLGYSRFI